jgi:hypothetical protein
MIFRGSWPGAALRHGPHNQDHSPATLTPKTALPGGRASSHTSHVAAYLFVSLIADPPCLLGKRKESRSAW